MSIHSFEFSWKYNALRCNFSRAVHVPTFLRSLEINHEHRPTLSILQWWAFYSLHSLIAINDLFTSYDYQYFFLLIATPSHLSDINDPPVYPPVLLAIHTSIYQWHAMAVPLHRLIIYHHEIEVSRRGHSTGHLSFKLILFWCASLSHRPKLQRHA